MNLYKRKYHTEVAPCIRWNMRYAANSLASQLLYYFRSLISRQPQFLTGAIIYCPKSH